MRRGRISAAHLAVRVTLDDPADGREGVFIGFESKEPVDRESRGSFFYRWK